MIGTAVAAWIGAVVWWRFLRAGMRESAEVPDGSSWWPRRQDGRRVSPVQALARSRWRDTGTSQPEGAVTRSGHTEAA